MSGIIIRVTLEGSCPEVWRKLLLPERISLADLHEVLRVVFGWTGRRTHEYYCDSESIGYLELEDESRVALDAFGPAGPGLCYIYDFRDDWRHMIQVEGADPAWKARFAKVLEYQGDNFVEGIGGVERVDAPDYDPAKERAPFVLAEINRSLKGRVFSKCAGSDVEDRIRALTCAADVSGTEQQAKAKTKDSADFASEIQTAASDSIGVRKNEGRLQEAKTALYEKQKGNSEKKLQELLEGDYSIERELQKSPVEKRVDTWNDFCEELTVAKNISRKSPAELLLGMRERAIKDYDQLFGVTGEEFKNATTAEEAIWNRLESHPDYLAYLFEWSQMEQLLRFAKMPNTVCTDVPNQELIDMLLRLGLLDLTVETVNRSKFLMLRQTKEMGEILAAHTEAEWKKLCEKAQTMEKQCMAIINLYGAMSTEAFCEKYQAYYGRNTETGEIKRCVYLGARTRGKVNVSRADIGKEIIFLAGIEEVKLDSKDKIDSWDSLEYRNFTARERKQASHDCWAMYPAWKDLYETLFQSYDDMEESELKRWMYGEYVLTLEGRNLKELWERLEMYCQIETLDLNVYLWQTMLGIYLTTGLAKYKGYSRREYARRKNIPLADVCGKFSLIDYETSAGSGSDSRPEKERIGNAELEQQPAILEGRKASVDREKLSRIKRDTHLREFPEETQLAIYQIWSMHDGKPRTTSLAYLWIDLGVRNRELDYLLAVLLLNIGEYQLALESLLAGLKKELPDDMALDSIMQLAQENMAWEQKKDPKIRKLIETGQRDAEKEEFSQTPAPANPNAGKAELSVSGTDGANISVGVTKNGEQGIPAGSVILDGTSASASGSGQREFSETDDFGVPAGTTYRRMQPKIGRNDPCPCGSGKKYKKCCGR